MNRRRLALAHGGFNVVTGGWALVHLRSFEAFTGPKTDHWLVRTVAALVVANGIVQLAATGSPDAVAQARRVGLGTAAALAGIDAAYLPRGTLGPAYLLDAAAEVGWLLAWLRASR